jgi:hypothetical protein
MHPPSFNIRMFSSKFRVIWERIAFTRLYV